jgi:hypothetical protein
MWNTSSYRRGVPFLMVLPSAADERDALAGQPVGRERTGDRARPERCAQNSATGEGFRSSPHESRTALRPEERHPVAGVGMRSAGVETARNSHGHGRTGVHCGWRPWRSNRMRTTPSRRHRPEPFRAQAFLDSAGLNRTIATYPRGARIFSQGDPATECVNRRGRIVRISQWRST